MSKENVELVRRAYAVMAQGDIFAMLEYLDPAIELHVSDAYFDAPHTYHGHEGYRDLIAAQVEVFDEFRAEPEHFFDAGEECPGSCPPGGRARASGVASRGKRCRKKT